MAKTILIREPDGGQLLINEKDFNPAIHELWVDAPVVDVPPVQTVDTVVDTPQVAEESKPRRTYRKKSFDE